MNNLIRIIAISSLVFAMLIVGACNLITTPNTSFNFSSLYDATQWIEEHRWVIMALVSETGDKSSMRLDYIGVNCHQNGVVSYDDDYRLWINDREIPLEVYSYLSQPTVRVNWDLIHGDLSIPHSNKIHFVFHINGVEEINKIVLNPSSPVFDPFDFGNVDFSSPVVVSWSMRNDADLQVFQYHTTYSSIPGDEIARFVDVERRDFTLDIDEILDGYSYIDNNPTTDNLTIRWFGLAVYNFEEDGLNAVCAMKMAEIGEWKAKTEKTPNNPKFPWDNRK